MTNIYEENKAILNIDFDAIFRQANRNDLLADIKLDESVYYFLASSAILFHTVLISDLDTELIKEFLKKHNLTLVIKEIKKGLV